jgi:hypothetical protein
VEGKNGVGKMERKHEENAWLCGIRKLKAFLPSENRLQNFWKKFFRKNAGSHISPIMLLTNELNISQNFSAQKRAAIRYLSLHEPWRFTARKATTGRGKRYLQVSIMP